MNLPLSISLLASNRIGSLERCLDSLKPLLQKVPAELIVVFTGVDERVWEVAERYTDQIIPFTWCNDFAKARNAGLEQAKGEWFMYIDDDEWFDDVTEICDFFLSGEYKEYDYAYYTVRSYDDWNGITYTDSKAYRLAKRLPELCFLDSIHEALPFLGGRGKYFDSYVHHYGYVRDEEKKNKQKNSRNIPLLLEDIQKRPNYIKNYIQLIQEYFGLENWNKAEEYSRRARERCQDMGNTIFQGRLQVLLIETLYGKEDFEQAEKEAIMMVEKENPCLLAKLMLYCFLIVLYARKEDSEKTLHYGILFEKTLTHLDEALESGEERGHYLDESMVKNPERLYPGRINCAKAALDLRDYEKAAYFLNLLPWEEDYMFQQFYPLLDQWWETYEDQALELLINLPYESPYLLFQRLIYQEKSGKKNVALFDKCQEKIEHPYLRRKLVEKALWEQRDFSLMLDRMDLDTWKTCIKEIVEDTPYTEVGKLWKALKQLFDEHLIQGLWMKKLLLEKDLSRGFLMKTELMKALREYAECIVAFYQMQYYKEMFSDKSRHLLPVDCRQTLVVLDALEKLDQKQPAEAVRLLRTALKLYPQMTGVIREVLRLLTHEVENPAETAGAEFLGLAVQMKEAVKGMMEQGQFQEALSVVSQLFPLLPEDMELLRLHQKLLAQLG